MARTLADARKGKNDEFHTQLTDIEKELKPHFHSETQRQAVSAAERVAETASG